MPLLLLLLITDLAVRGATPNPRVVSLSAGNLRQQGIFDISFEQASQGSIKMVWIAAANGLHAFDGYRWRRYGTKDGLPSNFVRCVLATRSGDLWVGTDKGAGVFKPPRFDPRGSGQGLAGPNVRRIIEDSAGTIWFTSDSWPNAKVRGGIASLRGGQWQAWHKEDGLPSDYVVNEFTDSRGRAFAMTLAGPAHLEGSRWVADQTKPLRPGTHWGSGVLAEVPGLGLIVSNGDRVLSAGPGGRSNWREVGTPLHHPHGLLATRDGRVVIAADTRPAYKAFFEWDGTAWVRRSDEFAVPRLYGEEIREAPDGSVWYVGFDCLVRWERTRSEWSRIADQAPGSIFSDGGGGIWAAAPNPWRRVTRRLFQLTEQGWTPKGSVKAHTTDGRGSVWAITDASVERWRAGSRERWSASAAGLSFIFSLSAVGKNGTVWLAGRDSNGLAAFAYFDGAWHTRTEPTLGRPARMDLAGSPQAGVWCSIIAPAAEETRLLRVSDQGIQMVPLPEKRIFPFESSIYPDPSGGVWLLGGTSAFRMLPGGEWMPLGNLPAKRVRSAGFQGRRTWLVMDSAFGGQNGIWRDDPEQGQQFFPADFTADFTQSPDGTLVASGLGRLHVIPPGAATPAEIRLPDPSAMPSAFRDSQGAYLVATPSGLTLFRPDGVPPETDVTSSANGVLAGQPFVAMARSRERFLPAEASLAMTYSWSLDGGPWSPFAESGYFEVPSRRLGQGTHRLLVRSRDNGQDIDPTPAVALFDVHPLPLQERSWFLPVLAAALGTLAMLSALALQARRKVAAQAAELETRVQERTASLREEMAERGRVEADLRSSDQLYREIVEGAQEGIAIFGNDGLCRLANGEFGRLVNQAVSDLIGKHYREFLDPAALARVDQEFRGGLAGRSNTYELTLRPPGCEPRDVWISGHPIVDLQGRVSSMLVTAVDLSAQKKAEQAIRLSEAYYRQLFEANPNPLFVIDLDSLRILAVNPAVSNVYGYDTAEMLSMSILDLQLDENREVVCRMLAQPMPAPCRVAWRHLRKDRQAIDVEFSAQDIEFRGRRARLAMVTDTTERNRAVRALRESEANLALAQRLAHVGSFQYAVDGSQGASWSDEVRRILGVEDGFTLSPAALMNLVYPADLNAWCTGEAKARASGEPVEFEHRISRPDGTVRQLRTTLATAAVGAGSSHKVLTGTMQDVTEYRHLEEQLRQSQKLESIGRLAGGVAHDFNNLLTVINGYSGRILKSLDPHGELHAEAAQVVEAGRQAASLTRQLLTFGRKQKLKPQPVDINDAIAGSLTLLSPLIGETIELVTEFAPGPLLALVDPSQFQQVLLNLAVNARDAMPRGGRLTIRTVAPAIKPAIVAMEVIDTGVGMSEEVRRRLFEPFFTTKDRAGGTGLGLSTVYGIVQQSCGTIQVESEPGKGALFRVRFPRLDVPAGADAPAGPLRAGAGPGTPAPGQPVKTVLLVEDQGEVREFAARVLRSAGYRVHEAAHGAAALACSADLLRSIDLVLTDMIMPGMTGLELVKALRHRRGPDDSLRVLYVSGYTADVIRSDEAGQVPILEKPFVSDDLLRRVAELLSPDPLPR